MNCFKNFRINLPTISIIGLCIILTSCKKEYDLPSTSSDNAKMAMIASVGLPPPIIAWLKGPIIPIVDQHGLAMPNVYDAFGFGINGKGYIGGGLNYFGHTGTTWQYDTLTHSWSQAANFPGSNDMLATTFAINDNGYVCTGGGNGSKENWQYNQLTNVWTRKADFAGPSRFGAVGAAINGKAYVGLGTNSDNSNLPDSKDWWQYDPVTDSWTRKADFPGTARQYSIAFATNNKIYVATGYHFNRNTHVASYFNDLWQYNPTNDTWTQKADIPAVGRAFAVGFSTFTNKGVVATGDANDYLLNDCWQYNPSNNSWFQLPNVGGGVRAFASGFTLGNTIYIGTGDGAVSNDFWGLRLNP